MSIDGMDHSALATPKLARVDKTLAGVEKIETHLTGVLVHGREPNALCYTWADCFPSGSDVVATVMLDTFAKLQEKEELPPKLYLWLDNCWRENKNRSTYCFFEHGVYFKQNICTY